MTPIDMNWNKDCLGINCWFSA